MSHRLKDTPGGITLTIVTWVFAYVVFAIVARLLFGN